jgi:PREDICTED: similar to prolylcarboxypeptidase
LQYLSIERALYDFAEVIMNMKENDPKAKHSPVIMFGGSYGGMLAAWFRMKYPHLVEGSV